MLKSVNIFGRKKTTKPFADFYADWFTTLSATLLPHLRRLLSSPSTSPSALSLHVDSIHHHFNSYYAALDLAAAADVAQCLHPSWRNNLETPFLWLADLHPYLFTNLLRSFLDDQDEDHQQSLNDDFLDKPWHVGVAWRSPSRALTARVDQIECGLRLMVPALAARARHAQAKMVESVGAKWVSGKGAVEEAVAAEMEEMVGVVVDANRLRRSVLADVLSVTSVYQSALFLEALGMFLVGFRDDKLIREFGKCDIALN